jgi:iron complex transport system ATP-binding protein
MTLEAKNVSLSYGQKAVLKTVSIACRRGEIVGLLGPNGAGKSSLLKIVSGLLPPSGGDVHLDDRSLHLHSPQERARKVAYLPQQRELHWDLSVREVVALGRLPHRRAFQGTSHQDEEHIERALATLDLNELQNRHATRLSGGEQARVLLARALAQDPEFLLADEPTAGLDPKHRLHLLQKLSTLAERGLGTLIALHDLTLAARFCHRLVVLHNGRIHSTGPANDVLDENTLREVYEIRAHIASIEGRPVITPLSREHS